MMKSATRLLALLLPAAFPFATAMAQDLLVRAPKVVIAPDTVLQDGALLIRNGAVLHVGSEIPVELRDRARKLDFDGTLVPAFVNPHTTLGRGADLFERISAFTPDLRAADAFDPFDEELAKVAKHGVITCGLAPASGNTLAGLAAVVSTAPGAGGILAEEAYLKIALVQTARSQDRYPTSLMGAADLLRQSLEAVRGVQGAGDPAFQVLRQVLSGSRRVAIHADTHAEITTALELCEQYGLQPIVLGGRDAGDSLERLAALRAAVVLEPLRASSPRRQLELPARLEKAGIRLAFGGEDAAALRFSAALAVRHGLSRQGALAALTRVPAELCEVEDKAGSLRSGCRADFLVFGGDPLDLSSPLLAVYAQGTRIDARAQEDQEEEEETR